MLRTLAFLAVLASLAPARALADRRELYTELAFTPALLVARAPTADSTASRPALGGEFLAYYGLTNTLHVGLALQAASATDLAFATDTGTLYANLLDLSARALVAYRLDTGSALAPIARLEVGIAHDRFSQLQVLYQGFATPAPAFAETSLTAGAAIAAEYRIGDHLVAVVGLHARRTFGRLAWSLDLPVSFGAIW